jgi:hypothetical protein
MLALTAALTGCGGGGGGASAAGATTEPRDVPLALTAANAMLTAKQAFQSGGVTLSLGQLAVDWAAAADAANGASVTTTNAMGGSLIVELLDRDANHHVSPGDRLTVRLNNYYLTPLEDYFTGTLTIDMVTPMATQQQGGTITFGSQFDVANSGSVTIRLGGSLRYDYSADRLARSIHVTSASQPFTVTASQGSKSVAEAITQVDVMRTARRDTARATTSMRLHYASDALGGAIDASTPTSWASWFDSYPDVGELAITGAAGQVTQIRASTNGASMFDLLFGGTVISQVSAVSAVTPYLWSGTGWYTASGNELGYITQPAAYVGFKVMAQQPTPTTLIPQPGSLTWSYSRPLAIGTVTSATFMPTTSVPNQVGSSVPVPATVLIEGALLSVTPTTQLVPGMNYYLAFNNGNIGSITDTNGATLSMPVFSADVALTIVASAKINGVALLFGPTATLKLDAGASSALGGLIASTHWSQVSGPALTITGAETSVATVSPASGSGNGQAVVEVEVRNSAGDMARTQLSFQVVADPAQTLVMAYRAGTGPMNVTVADLTNGSSYARYFANYDVLDLYGGGRLLAGLPAGTAWLAGVDVTYGAGGTPGVNVVWIQPGSQCMSGPTGHLKVLDYAVDAAGTVTRVAIDFEETCAGVTTTASIRLGASLALQP